MSVFELFRSDCIPLCPVWDGPPGSLCTSEDSRGPVCSVALHRAGVYKVPHSEKVYYVYWGRILILEEGKITSRPCGRMLHRKEGNKNQSLLPFNIKAAGKNIKWGRAI